MKYKTKTKSGKVIPFNKEKTDPLCIRVSTGGTAEQGYYMTFRGDNLEEIETMLEEVLDSFKQAKNRLK